MPQVWPFPANSRESLLEGVGYRTKVYRALSGQEQREQLRRHPIGSLEATYTIHVAQHSDVFQSVLYPNQAKEWIVPLWPYQMPSETALAPAATQIDVSTVDVPHRDHLDFGSYALIWSDPLTYEAIIPTSIASSFIQCSGVTKTWGTSGVYVFPTRIGRLSESVSWKWMARDIIEARVRFILEPPTMLIPSAEVENFVIMDGGVLPIF